MAQVYTTKTPDEGRHFKLAPYVTTNVPGRAGWYGYALERHSDGTVSVIWTETNEDVQSSHKPIEWIKFEDLIWIEGFPKDESPELIRCIFTEADAVDIGIDVGVGAKDALERSREWGKAITDTITNLAGEQLSSAIHTGEV